MNYMEIIEKGNLIICNNNIKVNILNYMSKENILRDIKFMTFEEFKKKAFYDYNEETIFYIMNKYNVNYEIAKTYIENTYYVKDKEYKSEKLNHLVLLKKELIEKKLFIFDDLFNDYIYNKKIIVCEKNISKFEKNTFENIKTSTSITYYDFQYNNYKHNVIKFNSIDEEVTYVAYSICELIDNGIDINKIKIANINDDYNKLIKRIFSFYNIPVNLSESSFIYGTKICQDFLKNYNSDIVKAIESIEIYKDNPIYNQIINICNKYTFIDNYLKVKEMIIHDLKNTIIFKEKLLNAVEIIDLKDIINDEYVFLMNFNLGIIPQVYKDEDYISDAIKPYYMDTTIEKNKKEKEVITKCINNIKNLTITYKLKTPTNVFYPSNLVDLYNEVLAQPNIYKSYSKINDEINLASLYDKLIKYGTKSETLSILNNNYKIQYRKYDNSFKGINKTLLHEYIDNKINLSYSKLEDYNECAFKYYISNILNLNIFEDNFSAVLGTIFHHILETGLKKEIDIDDEINKCLQKDYKERVFSKKETFFIENTKKNMMFVLDVIKKQMINCKLDSIKTEEKVVINKEGNLKVKFTGIIDKLLYKQDDDKTIVAIIDYKTGNPDIELGYFSYGLHLQLPIYLYLTSNMQLKNVKYAGIYLQKVMPGIDKIDKTGKINKEDKMKLEGYSTNNKEILGFFDLSYKDSQVIKGMGLKQDGSFKSYAKVLKEKDFDKLISLTNDKIDECINNISNAKFDINPVQEENDKEITACKYCKYNDICYKTKHDVRKIYKDKKFSYLGGDIND